MMHRIWALPDRESYDVSSLEVVWHMAAPMPPALKEQWIGWLGGERIWELYGGTEGQGLTVLNGIEWLAKRGSVGRIQGESKVKVVNERGEDCEPGEVGEIYFWAPEGPGTTYHYLGAELKSLDGWESSWRHGLDRRRGLSVPGRPPHRSHPARRREYLSGGSRGRAVRPPRRGNRRGGRTGPMPIGRARPRDHPTKGRREAFDIGPFKIYG